MKLRELLSGRNDFENLNNIKKLITSSKKYEPSYENWKHAHELLIFSTPRQKTWLIATIKRLYCILDDVSRDAPHIAWSMSKESLVTDDKVSIEVRQHENTERTGLIDISDKHKSWLYSKNLFNTKSVEKAVIEFIEQAMIFTRRKKHDIEHGR